MRFVSMFINFKCSKGVDKMSCVSMATCGCAKGMLTHGDELQQRRGLSRKWDCWIGATAWRKTKLIVWLKVLIRWKVIQKEIKYAKK